jgi:hypothetical protein
MLGFVNQCISLAGLFGWGKGSALYGSDLFSRIAAPCSIDTILARCWGRLARLDFVSHFLPQLFCVLKFDIGIYEAIQAISCTSKAFHFLNVAATCTGICIQVYGAIVELNSNTVSFNFKTRDVGIAT